MQKKQNNPSLNSGLLNYNSEYQSQYKIPFIKNLGNMVKLLFLYTFSSNYSIASNTYKQDFLIVVVIKIKLTLKKLHRNNMKSKENNSKILLQPNVPN